MTDTKVRRLVDGRGLVKISPVTRGIINGTEDLSTWDDEELERGIRRGKDGRFRRPPRLVAKAVHDELVRRRMSKAYDLLRESVYDAVALLREVVTDPKADVAARLKASELILDRALGKPKEAIDLHLDGEAAPWQRLVAAAIVATEDDVGSQGRDDVVDGEVVEG